MGSLGHTLVAAGWVPVAAPKQYDTENALVRGVVIDVDASKDPELLKAANALASALNAEGISAKVNTETETDSTTANVIHILVGPKS